MKPDISQFVDTVTEQTVLSELPQRVRARRKAAKLTQKGLAARSGVSYASIRRFESTGEISIISLVKIANALDCLEDFNLLFAKTRPTNLKDYN